MRRVTDKFLLQQSALRNYDRAPEKDVKSLFRWHRNHDFKAIWKEEQEYLNSTDKTPDGKIKVDTTDLICVVPKDKPPLRRIIDSSLFLRTLKLWEDKRRNVPEDPGLADVSYYSEKRMDRFVTAAIVILGMAMLVAPLWVLQALGDLKKKLVVITVFVLVFLLVVSFTMVAKPFEALAATAA